MMYSSPSHLRVRYPSAFGIMTTAINVICLANVWSLSFGVMAGLPFRYYLRFGRKGLKLLNLKEDANAGASLKEGVKSQLTRLPRNAVERATRLVSEENPV